MTKQTNWTEFPPLVEAKAKLAELQAAEAELTAASAAMVLQRDRDRQELDDAEAQQLAGTTVKMDMARLRQTVATAEAKERELLSAIQVSKNAIRLIQERVQAAWAEAHEGALLEYNIVLRAMRDALQKAREANDALIEATKQVEAVGKPPMRFYWNDLVIVPGHGDLQSRLAYWLMHAKLFLKED